MKSPGTHESRGLYVWFEGIVIFLKSSEIVTLMSCCVKDFFFRRT